MSELATTHYPSWGFETCEGSDQLALFDTPSHYPSWGFETFGVGLHGQNLRGLITPHGDLKPASFAGSSTMGTSHYPSWGFETAFLAGRPFLSSDSLPLMGI